MAPPAMNGTNREICTLCRSFECCSLNEDGERGDERRALGGRNDVKPNGRGRSTQTQTRQRRGMAVSTSNEGMDALFQPWPHWAIAVAPK